MQKMTLEDMRSSQLALLDRFDVICRENNIRYTLAGGTLLGAIRHNGYIPWDDDIDVMVPQPDYCKILELRDKFETERFVLKTPYDKSSNLPFTYIKMCDMSTILIEEPNSKKINYNIYIDIFPCQGLPSDEKKSLRHFKKGYGLDRLFQILQLSNYNKNFGSFIRRFIWLNIYLFSNIFSISKIMKKIDLVANKYAFDSSEFVGNMFCGQGVKEKFHRSSFELTEHIFEGKMYKIIVGYDEYLRNLYGDYMKLPPKEKQVLKHDCIAYFKDKN